MDSHTENINDLLKSVSWLIGKWKSTNGSGFFPGTQDFQYHETLEFRPCGKQPVLQYTNSSSHPVKLNPMHLECGFLRAISGGRFAFMVSHNFGVVTIEEGELVKTENLEFVKLDSILVNRMTASEPKVLKTQRTFKLDSVTNTLQQEFFMSTTRVPELTKHLVADYKKE